MEGIGFGGCEVEFGIGMVKPPFMAENKERGDRGPATVLVGIGKGETVDGTE